VQSLLAFAIVAVLFVLLAWVFRRGMSPGERIVKLMSRLDLDSLPDGTQELATTGDHTDARAILDQLEQELDSSAQPTPETWVTVAWVRAQRERLAALERTGGG
jgi:hypothetical protein